MGERLAGRVALVTGASKGIGKAIATAYAAEGAAVMLSSRKQDGLDAAVAELLAAIPDARLATFAANAGEEDQAAACVAATIDQFGALDVLVNNAATNPVAGLTIDADLGAWDKTFRVNLRGALAWSQCAWRSWMQEHGGSIVNISSIGGIGGTSGIGTYNVTKAAMIHLTKVLAAELAPGVTVNSIAPGLVRTDFARALWEPLGPDANLVVPEDIAEAAVYLASDAAARITGTTIVIDAGALVLRSVV